MKCVLCITIIMCVVSNDEIKMFNQSTKNPWHKDVADRQMYNCVWYFCTYPYGLRLNVWHALLCIANNRHGVTITPHSIKRHFFIWMTKVRQPTKRRRSCVLTLIYTFICVYLWTRLRINNTLIAVDRYLRLMGDKTIPDSAEPRLESFYPPFVAGIDLPQIQIQDSDSIYFIHKVTIWHISSATSIKAHKATSYWYHPR